MKTVCAAILSVATSIASQPWWVNPVVKVSAETGILGSDPHFMSLSEDGKWLLVVQHSHDSSKPVQLFDAEGLSSAHGAVSLRAFVQATMAEVDAEGETGGGSWKGGAVSSAAGIAVLGSGSTAPASFCGFDIACPARKQDAPLVNFSIFSERSISADGLAFNNTGAFLYSNQYNGNRNLIHRWLVGKSGVVPAGVWQSGVKRIRNISCKTVNGRDLIYYGEACGENPKGICVLDAESGVEKVLLELPSWGNGESGVVANVQTACDGSADAVLCVQTGDGWTGVWELSSDGLSAGSKLREISPEQMRRLAGLTDDIPSKFRCFALSPDGRFAYIAHAVPANWSGGTRVRVLAFPDEPAYAAGF